MQYGARKLYADLGAQKLMAATKAKRKIVVEVKSFVSPSEVEDLREALGSFYLYYQVLTATSPGWELYLAVPQEAYEGIFSEPLGHLLIEQATLRLLVFDEELEVIQQWIP